MSDSIILCFQLAPTSFPRIILAFQETPEKRWKQQFGGRNFNCKLSTLAINARENVLHVQRHPLSRRKRPNLQHRTCIYDNDLVAWHEIIICMITVQFGVVLDQKKQRVSNFHIGIVLAFYVAILSKGININRRFSTCRPIQIVGFIVVMTALPTAAVLVVTVQ